MIIKMFKKMLGLAQAEAKVEELKKQGDKTLEVALQVMDKRSKWQKRMVKKTVTYYIGTATGGINHV